MSRRVLPLALCATLLAIAGAPTVTAAAPPSGSRTEQAEQVEQAEPRYRFVAAPDIFNQDIADVRGEPGWDRGEPNSWTPQLDTAVETVLGEIGAQDPGSLLVAGDLVQGHWGVDVMETGIFGPTRTTAQRVASLRRAGHVYHGANAARFAEHELTLHAAVGDHDIGDNPWANGGADLLRFKQRQVPVFRRLFAQHYTQRTDGSSRYANRPVGTQWSNTAYAVRLHPDVLLVTVDVFHRTERDVRAEVVGGQLRWLKQTLDRARRQKVRWVVVQGHVPALTPVRTYGSSAMSIEGGRRSPLWRAMVDGGVDLYLAGEVHATALRTADGVTQITTGSPVFLGRATYLTADAYDGRMELTVNEFRATYGSYHQPIWQGADMRSEGNLSYPDPSQVTGTATLLPSGRLRAAAGSLLPYPR